MPYTLPILFFASPILLLASYLMTMKSKSFRRIFAIHTIVFISYMIFTANYAQLLTGHDEYGLGQLVLGISFIVGHVLIGFVHALYIKFKNNI